MVLAMTGMMARSRRLGVAALSYAAPEDTRSKQAVIRLVERLSGQARVERIYRQVRASLRPEDDVWAQAMRGLDITVRHDPCRLADVPRQGPLVVVANHPFGVVDGLALCHLVAKVRQDFRVVAMSTLCRMPEIRAHVLPINFANTRDAVATSARSRAAARALLIAGGCLLIFPAGAVSTSRRPFGLAEDAPWHPFVGRLVQSSRSAVLPVRFEGQNSRLFQLVSQVSPTLRLSLLLREAVSRIGTEIEAHVGRVLSFESLAAFDDPKALVEHLREVTYGLEPGMPARPVSPRRRLAWPRHSIQ
jgi:putative hemolysin